MNVLIADDEPMTRSLLRRVLVREFNCPVSEAKDGLEALSVAGSKPTNLIITDLRMPVMDGIELLEALRQFPPLAGVPVVMMTAARETGPVHRAIELGVTDYLLKPLQADRVAKRLRAVIDKISRQGVGSAVDVAGRVEIDDQTPLLIADGSADFRHFFVSTLSSNRIVHQASSGVVALQRCVESRPGIVVVGSELGVLGPELLMRKLRSMPELSSTRIFAILPKQALDQSLPAGLADAILTRTFVPDDFRAQFERSLGRMRKAEDVLAAHPSLRLQVASAAEQVFGMMLQIEVQLSFDVQPRPVPEVVIASATLGLPDTSEDLTMALRSDLASASRIAAGMTNVEVASVSRDDALGAVAEVLNIIAGLVKTALEDSGVRATLGASTRSIDPAGDLSAGATGKVQATVQTADAGIQFVLQLFSRPAGDASAPTPSEVAPAPAPAS